MSIKIEHLNYVYSPGTAYEKHALKDICLEIPHGEFVGIIGHTGSGKSTLIQHLNGLVKGSAIRMFTDKSSAGNRHKPVSHTPIPQFQQSIVVIPVTINDHRNGR